MLHVDPLGHHLRGGHDDLQQPAARILKVVIRVKKRAPLQIERLGDVSPGNDEGRVPRQAPFRPDLAPVGAAPADMRCGLVWQQGDGHIREPRATLLAGELTGLFEVLEQPC